MTIDNDRSAWDDHRDKINAPLQGRTAEDRVADAINRQSLVLADLGEVAAAATATMMDAAKAWAEVNAGMPSAAEVVASHDGPFEDSDFPCPLSGLVGLEGVPLGATLHIETEDGKPRTLTIQDTGSDQGSTWVEVVERRGKKVSEPSRVFLDSIADLIITKVEYAS